MVAPSTGSSSGEMQIAPPPQGLETTPPASARRFLRTFGFQLLIGLLGIALAFL